MQTPGKKAVPYNGARPCTSPYVTLESQRPTNVAPTPIMAGEHKRDWYQKVKQMRSPRAENAANPRTTGHNGQSNAHVNEGHTSTRDARQFFSLFSHNKTFHINGFHFSLAQWHDTA